MSDWFKDLFIDEAKASTRSRIAMLEPLADDIPKVFFGKALPQTKDYTAMPFRYVSKTMNFSGYCQTKAQGNGSMIYPKKNQTVKLYKDSECKEKLKVNFKDWGEQSKFCFKANWIDITHARNIVSARLWGDIVKSRSDYAELPELLRTSPNQGAVDGFPVKVYAAGIYQGRYTINIPKDAWMANMNDDLDEHCILCAESDDAGKFLVEAAIDGTDFTDEVHDTVPESIKTRWNEGVRFIQNSTDEEFKAGIGAYFDVQSLIDYYLFGMGSCGLDAFARNQLFLTYDGKKWFADMYDMDATWGTFWDGGLRAADYSWTQFEARGENLLYNRLISAFYEEIQKRWEELRSGVLSIEHITARFEQFTDIASRELVEEDYAETTANGAFTAIPETETNNIQQIRSYALARLAYCDEQIPKAAVPAEYTAVSYIESDGTQYIDTGVSGGVKAAYEITFANIAGNAGYAHYFAGAYADTIPRLLFVGCVRGQYGAMGEDYEYRLPIYNDDSDIHTIKYTENCKFYCDGLPYDTYGDVQLDSFVANGWGAKSWYVFNSHEESWLYAKMRLYSLKMYTDGKLVRAFTPAKRNADGVYGLYDNITKTFFVSAGTGAFTGA